MAQLCNMEGIQYCETWLLLFKDNVVNCGSKDHAISFFKNNELDIPFYRPTDKIDNMLMEYVYHHGTQREAHVSGINPSSEQKNGFLCSALLLRRRDNVRNVSF